MDSRFFYLCNRRVCVFDLVASTHGIGEFYSPTMAHLCARTPWPKSVPNISTIYSTITDLVFPPADSFFWEILFSQLLDSVDLPLSDQKDRYFATFFQMKS